MKLKELIDNTPFGEISKELKRTLHSVGRFYDEEYEKIFKHVVDTLKSLTPVMDDDCKIWAGRHDASGLYSDEKREELGIDSYLVSLVATPWEEWLGMDIDPELLTTAKPAVIVAGCLWEMTFFGFDKEERERTIERELYNGADKKETPPLQKHETSPRGVKWRKWKGTAFIKEGTTEIPDRSFKDNANIIDVRIPKTVKRIGCEAFKGCPLTSIDIPEGVTEIGEEAFENCYELRRVSLPASLESIAADTFRNCGKLKGIVIPEGVAYIDECAFNDCDSLKDVSLPASLHEIGEMAFFNCSKLKSIALPDGLKQIDKWAFAHTGLESVELPESLECIITDAFEDCPLSSIRIPAGLTEIAGWPFWGCPLESISVDKDNKVYDSRENCNALVETATNSIVATCENSVIPTSIKEVFDWAFKKNKKVTDVVIPDSVEEIGWFAFAECPNLTSVTIPASVRMIWPGAFSECPSLKTITVPAGTSDYYKKMLWKELHSIVVEGDNPSSPTTPTGNGREDKSFSHLPRSS
jgi:ferredoxin